MRIKIIYWKILTGFFILFYICASGFTVRAAFPSDMGKKPLIATPLVSDISVYEDPEMTRKKILILSAIKYFTQMILQGYVPLMM